MRFLRLLARSCIPLPSFWIPPLDVSARVFGMRNAVGRRGTFSSKMSRESIIHAGWTQPASTPRTLQVVNISGGFRTGKFWGIVAFLMGTFQRRTQSSWGLDNCQLELGNSIKWAILWPPQPGGVAETREFQLKGFNKWGSCEWSIRFAGDVTLASVTPPLVKCGTWVLPRNGADGPPGSQHHRANSAQPFTARSWVGT